MPVDNDVDPLMHGAAGLEILAELDERLTEEICLDGAKRESSDIALLPVVRQFSRVELEWFMNFGSRRLREWLWRLRRPGRALSVLAGTRVEPRRFRARLDAGGAARRGGSWTAFILPSALLMFGFALIAGDLSGPLAEAVIHGLKIAAVAVVAQALLGMARTLTSELQRLALAVAAMAAVLLVATSAAQIAIILWARLLGWSWETPAR